MLLCEGKAKKVYKFGEKTVLLEFKDDATAGNKAKHDVFFGKGELNCEMSAMLLRYLNNKFYQEGSFRRTHFIDRIDSFTQLCHRVNIIPLEVIVRNFSAGTFCKRYGIDKGIKFQSPIIEFCLKNDDLNDPLITENVISELGIADRSTLEQMKLDGMRINRALSPLFEKMDLTLVDFKLEFGNTLTTGDDRIILADEICPDTMRLWDSNGNSYDKDLYREETGDLLTGYKIIRDGLISIGLD